MSVLAKKPESAISYYDEQHSDALIVESHILSAKNTWDVIGPYTQVYPTTNENLCEYEHLFHGRQNMLSVIGSSEQILNAILAGIEDIDAFDISRFAKYFLYLKKAAIQALSIEEYFELFHDKLESNEIHSKYYNMYSHKMRKFMDPRGLKFWDYLFNNYSWKSISNELYKYQYCSREFQKRNNKFLHSKDYHELGARLKYARIKVRTGDIVDLVQEYQKEYDLIYLSNIHSYTGLGRAKYILHELNLSDEGRVILAAVGSDTRFGSGAIYDMRVFNGMPYRFTREKGYFEGRRR